MLKKDNKFILKLNYLENKEFNPFKNSSLILVCLFISDIKLYNLFIFIYQ